MDVKKNSSCCGNTVATAKDSLETAPELEAMRREKIEAQIKQVQVQMDNLFACITPATKEMISEKLVQLDQRKKALQEQLDGVEGASEVKASSGLVQRLLEIAKEFNTLWAQATLEEKREFLSLFIESVEVFPKGEKAVIHLQTQYLREEQHEATKQQDGFPFRNRGDSHSPKQAKLIQLPDELLYAQFEFSKQMLVS